MLELTFAKFDGGSPLPTPKPSSGDESKHWADDPRVTIAWSALVLGNLDAPNRIAWQPTPGSDAHAQLDVTPHIDKKSGQICLGVEMVSPGAALAIPSAQARTPHQASRRESRAGRGERGNRLIG